MRLRRVLPHIKRLGSLFIAALLLLESVLLPIQANAGERTLYYHDDAVGSPVVMTDSSGNIIWRADYEPFGDEAVLNETPPDTNSHRFVGKEVDSETDLHYFGARFYDAELGRFLSTDPVLRLKIPSLALTHPQLLNNYSYSANNPYRFVDRDGRFIFPIIIAVTSAVITNLFFSSTVNAPANEQNLINSQTDSQFIKDTAIVETIGFAAGKIISKGVAAISGISKGSTEAAGEVISFANRQAAREAFSGAQQRAANRFFKGATPKSKDFMATELADGGKRLEFFSTANTPGYGKRYVQEIGSQGEVIREFKQTIGPSGVIETKWIHGGP